MLKDMRTQRHLKPGQRGTKGLLEKYGDVLLCVRYRYDEKRGIRIKTAEIVVEEKPWQPPFRYRDEETVPVAVAFEEVEFRERLRKARGRWDPIAKVWLVAYGAVRGTELEARIPAEFLKGSRR